jgi:Zn-finger protein
MNPKSAATSLNQVPALHKFIASLDVSFFDFGAGKKGKIDEFYASRKAPKVALFYDPFNRSEDENKKALEYLDQEGVDVLTCANVLNVLEDEYLERVISEIAELTRETHKGICFFSVYHNSRLPKNRDVRGHFQRNEPITWYVEKLKKEFDIVHKIGSFLMCQLHNPFKP